MSSRCSEARNHLTVAQAVDYWLENRRAEVRRNTWRGYKQISTYVIGPLLAGTKKERHNFARRGKRKPGAEFIEMLGATPISVLTTAQIRAWHATIRTQVGSHTANAAKKLLRAALCLAAEDFLLSLPPMPTRLGRGHTRPKKLILSPSQIGRLLDAAVQDKGRGLYYAFPFLTGVRPSEQLALLWEDVKLDEGVICIRRTQEPDGSVAELTKNATSAREIPICPLLRTMLRDWRALCPHVPGQENRVFPSLGCRGVKRPATQGRPLSYTNFIYTYWRPALAALDLPIVTPHSARHAFISVLQANGIEVGLVAKLAGHANPVITLGHYTQAVRGGEAALRVLEQAYAAKNPPSLPPANIYEPRGGR